MSSGLEGPAPDDRPIPGGRRNELGIRVDPDAEPEIPKRRAVLSALVKHEPGVLAKVSGLFSRRQFNIESLTVGPTANEDRARITLVIEEPEPGIVQAMKQLEKLIPVIDVTELSGAIERELALIKVDGESPDAVGAVAEMHDGTVVDVDHDSITVEVTGSEQQIDAALETFERFGIREIKRTGTAALARGDRSTTGADTQ